MESCYSAWAWQVTRSPSPSPFLSQGGHRHYCFCRPTMAHDLKVHSNAAPPHRPDISILEVIIKTFSHKLPPTPIPFKGVLNQPKRKEFCTEVKTVLNKPRWVQPTSTRCYWFCLVMLQCSNPCLKCVFAINSKYKAQRPGFTKSHDSQTPEK